MKKLFGHNFFKGVTSSYLLMLVNNLIGLWLIPYTLKFLTREEFSLYYVTTDLMLWLGIINLGTSSVFVTRVAQILGRSGDKTSELLSLVNTAFFIQCFFAVITTVLGIGGSFLLPWILDTKGFETQVQSTFMILSFSVGVALIGQVFSGLLVASKQIHIDNMIQLGLIIPRIVLTIVLLNLGYGIISLAYVNLFISVVGVLIPYIRVKIKLKHLVIKPTYYDKKLLPDFFGNGVWFSIGGIAGILILNMDRFVIGNFVGLVLVTNFIITQKLYDMAKKIVSQMVNISRPYISGLFGRQDMENMFSIYSVILIVTIITSTLSGTLIFLGNQFFISKWVGAEFYAGDEINLLMALNFILQAAVLPNRVLLASTLYKVKVHALIRLVEGLTNIALSVGLAHYLGMAGVLLGSVISTIVFSNVFLNFLIRNFFKLNHVLIGLQDYTAYLLVLLPVLLYSLNRYSFAIGAVLIVVILVILLLLYVYLKGKKKLFRFAYTRFLQKSSK